MCDDACEQDKCIPKERYTDSESALARDTARGSFVDHSDDSKEKLEAVLRHLNSENISFTRHKTRRNLHRYMIAIIKFSEFASKYVLAGVPFASPVISVVATVASKVFQEDIAETVFVLFREYLGEKFRRKCIAVSAIYRNIIRYLLEQPDSHNLAADCPISTGESVIQVLAVDIRCLSSQCDLREISGLMNKVHVYCCLSTLREFFLTARIVTEEKYGIKTDGTRMVLKSHGSDDSEILSFLYKPKRSQAAVFTRCLNVEKDWPVVWEFLSRRQLYITDLRSDFDNKTVRIWSKYYPDSCLPFHNNGVLSFLRCHRRSREYVLDLTRFVLHSELDGINKFTLQSGGLEDSYVYYGFWVKCGPYPQASLREWRIQKVLHENIGIAPSYLIMPASQPNRCIRTDWTGRVSAKQISPSERKCFWDIKILDT